MTYTKTQVLLEVGTLYQGFMPLSVFKIRNNTAEPIQIPNNMPFLALGSINPPRFSTLDPSQRCAQLDDGVWILHDGQKFWLQEEEYKYLELAE